ncbi:MAG TPA: sensor histidine kinase [Thermoanaerobaculia bacterium]|nr:sensor histidine kinase [Thermoanaerobaculia bacterium]
MRRDKLRSIRNRLLLRALAAWAAIALSGRAAPAADVPAETRRVLVVSSFGSRFAPFDALAAVLRTEIVRAAPGPVEFLEVPMEAARYEEPGEERTFADYLAAIVANRHLDLIVTVGAPPARLIARSASRFASVPTLMMGLDRRQVPKETAPNQVVVPIALDLPAGPENILRLLPETGRIAVVVGRSPLERFWKAEAEREFAPLSSRVSIEWFDALSLEQMASRAAALPPHSAILYGVLEVDAANVPHEQDQGLARLRASSNAPLFGYFESQLGRGIVGGPLIPIEREGRRSAAIALALLRGETPSSLKVSAPEPVRPAYDWRELRRWDIPEERLPAGSEILFRPPSLWQAYRRPVLFGVALAAIEALLIAALLAQRARRRRAEEQVHALNHRLLTAQEDERKAIARELHDDFSQRLARLAMDAARLEYAAAVPLESRAPAPMRDELARLSEDANALAYQLHPSTLDDLGLAEALRTECERFSRLEAIPVALDVDGAEPGMPRDTALCLFRIAQEGLRNVARHAKARSVSLSCRPQRGGLELTLKDDGVGFRAQRRPGRPSLGLASMRERVEVIGGRFRVDSAPGQGTVVQAWAPVDARAS